MTAAALSLLLLTAPDARNTTTGLHEQRFTQILARYHAASEAGERKTILCLEPKFRLAKSLMAEFASADDKRQEDIKADMTVLERSSARCLEMNAAAK